MNKRLEWLFGPLEAVPAVGERTATHYKRLCGHRVRDLLMHLPYQIIDRRTPYRRDLEEGAIATTVATPVQHLPAARHYGKKQPYKVICQTDTGGLTLTFFNVKGNYLKDQLPLNEQRVVSGAIHHYGEAVTMPHPDYIEKPYMFEKIARLEPVYHLTYGLNNKMVVRTLEFIADHLPDMPEWADAKLVEQRKWKPWRYCITRAHQPEEAEDISPLSLHRERLAYDELLAHQLALAITRASRKQQQGRETQGDGHLQSALREMLPFTLTEGQEEVLADIGQDMAHTHRMIRLLQGDVGSGKTVVALLAALNAVECGRQAVMMAPTEILARQHHAWISSITASLGVEVVLLTGQSRSKERKEALEKIANGRAQIVLGTHAVIEQDVDFDDLALVVIDEQHRFGVRQRLNLIQKGDDTDILLMSATPIPRTLALTFYGDMDVSQLTGKPAGRKPIATRTVSTSRMDEVVQGLERALEEGQQIYWICPLVKESEKSDLAAAEERFSYLQNYLEAKMGLVHGKMKAADREVTMGKFRDGEIRLLVATTVIEVGVDVPNATVMVIEHAERFGLSQLHQLRGRVGRGEKSSSCLLLYGEGLGENARRRMEVMRETEDGFKIAEEDLKLRGAGDILGTKQSGMPEFKLADMSVHTDLLLTARDDAKHILHTDPKLSSERGQTLRALLRLFDYDEEIPAG